MRDVYDILMRLEMEASTNGKKRIIEINKGNEVFKGVLSYALGQDRVFHLTELPPATGFTNKGPFFHLDYLSRKGSCTQADAQELANGIGPDQRVREVVTRILKKDLKCGVGAKMVNSVIPGLVFQVPYQRYSTLKDNTVIDFERDTVLAQVKYDGMFAYWLSSERFVTRNGTIFELPGLFFKQEDLIYTGEFLIGDLSRKESNGIMNSIIQGDVETYRKYKNILRYVIWGYVSPSDYTRGCSDEVYYDVWTSIPNTYLTSETRRVKSMKEVDNFYKDVRSRGGEGLMLKIANKLKWKSETSGSKFGLKVIPFIDIDVQIVDAALGDPGGKYENYMGRLKVQSQDGKIVSWVGGGFTDAERKMGVGWWKARIGSIITVRFKELITDKTDRETTCLSNARFIETRFNEKTEADTYEYIVELARKS